MRRTIGWRILAAIVLASLGAIGGEPTLPATASCAARTPAKLATGADAIFRGKVTAVGPGAPGRAIQRATFLVDTGWKGPVAREMAVLNIPSGAVSGHIELEREQTYLVFARPVPEGLGTDACMGTRRVEDAGAALAVGTGGPSSPDLPMNYLQIAAYTKVAVTPDTSACLRCLAALLAAV